MRFLALFLLLTGTLAAEVEFTTGQAARLVIGQETFTAGMPGASAKLLGAAGGVAYVNDTLFVADANRLGAGPLNQRVLIYKNLSSQLPGPLDELPQGSLCPVCVGEADVVLGQKTFEDQDLHTAAADTLRVPLSVASDGVHVAVADTDNNRVLIWNSIPAVNGQAADVVVGQPDFTSSASNGFNPTAESLKGPQGVWIQGGKLFVADTGNNRVLIWNSLPTQNGQPADIVLGQKDFTAFVQPDLRKKQPEAKADSLLTPVSVTSDGQRLYVADLGNNRVLIWNSIPTTNQAPADLVVGQADMEDAISNNSPKVCESNGEDSKGNPTYPQRCAATLSLPRYALSDGQKLFIADGGNDRILVFNELPTENGAKADAVLGQINEEVDLTSDNAFPGEIASPGNFRPATSLAWDGLNLYVADPFNRRILVFTMMEKRIANSGVRNAASFAVHAVGRVVFGGEAQEDDEVTIVIGTGDLSQQEGEGIDVRRYTYTVKKDDTLLDVTFGLTSLINANGGDPNVLAIPNGSAWSVILTARVAGEDGNKVKYRASVSENSKIVAKAKTPTLKGGGAATKIAPGTIIMIVGENLSDHEAVGEVVDKQLPRELAGVQVYLNGVLAPLYYVSPTQINAQMPVEFTGLTGVSAYVRTMHDDGRVVASNAIPVPIVEYNPGIFATGGDDPRPAVAIHTSSHAQGIISVDGSAKEGDVATIIIGADKENNIEGRRYSYTVTKDDEAAGDPANGHLREEGLVRIMNSLIELVNQDPEVQASRSSQFTRILLSARVEGAEGNGITFDVETSKNSHVILTAIGNELCCANEAGSLVTVENPALAGELISVFATGLGLVLPEDAREAQKTGTIYEGPELNKPAEFVSSLAGGKTANVIHAGLQVGSIGVYRIDLQLNSGLPTDNFTTVTIAQGFNVSNIVTIAVYNPTEKD